MSVPFLADDLAKIFVRSGVTAGNAFASLFSHRNSGTSSGLGSTLGDVLIGNDGATTPGVDVTAPTTGTGTDTTNHPITDSTSGATTFEGDFWSYLDGLLASTGDITKSNQEYNAEQAENQRAWLEDMSNTQYQRAVKDLKKAGLNPILALGNTFSGASVPSSAATASSNNVAGDTVGTFVSLVGDVLNILPALLKMMA